MWPVMSGTYVITNNVERGLILQKQHSSLGQIPCCCPCHVANSSAARFEVDCSGGEMGNRQRGGEETVKRGPSVRTRGCITAKWENVRSDC